MCNLMHTQTWMTCDCSANKHWVHVYICTSEEWLLDWAVLTSQWLVTGQETMQEIMQYQQAVSISLSLYTYKHTHTHTSEEWLVTVQYQQTVSAHVPEKNDLWLCSINKQWVHMYLRRMTCDSVVSTSSECICTWEEWLVTGQCQHGETQPHWPSYSRKGTDSQHGAVYVVALSVGHMGWCTLGGDQSESVHEWKQCKITQSSTSVS